jgi:hypothetical protein
VLALFVQTPGTSPARQKAPEITAGLAMSKGDASEQRETCTLLVLGVSKKWLHQFTLPPTVCAPVSKYARQYFLLLNFNFCQLNGNKMTPCGCCYLQYSFLLF